VQSAAISTLGRFGDPEIPMKMVDRWQGLSPVLRTEAITVLLERDDRVAAVLTELESGRIGARDFDSTQIEFLRTHHDSAVRERAARVFGAANPQRAAAYERFKPALAANGVAARGPQIFADRCARCHQFGGEGHAFGPELAGARIRGKEELLRAILVPGLEVEPGYVTQVIQTGAGENLVGLVFHESSSTITLRQPNGVEFVLPRTNIQSVQAQPWSMMPEGLEEGLTVEGMADLLDYLMVGR
jgi:putative heme-binding domain-containing protein